MKSQLNTLGVSIGLVFFILQPSQSLLCRRTPQDDYSCPVDHFSSDWAWCEIEKFDNYEFSFYLRPSSAFQKLMIRFDKRFLKAMDLGSDSFTVNNTLLSEDKWYHIHFWSRKGNIVSRDYYLTIDGQINLSHRMTLERASEFVVITFGSVLYSVQCDPENLVQQPPSTDSSLPRNIYRQGQSPIDPSSSRSEKKRSSSSWSLLHSAVIVALSVTAVLLIVFFIVFFVVEQLIRKPRHQESVIYTLSKRNPGATDSKTEEHIYESVENIMIGRIDQ